MNEKKNIKLSLSDEDLSNLVNLLNLGIGLLIEDKSDKRLKSFKKIIKQIASQILIE